MPASIHVFQCAGGGPYGFTNERNGSNLPATECLDGWEYVKTLEGEPFDLPRVAVDIEKVHVDISRLGYSIVPWTAAPG